MDIYGQIVFFLSQGTIGTASASTIISSWASTFTTVFATHGNWKMFERANYVNSLADCGLSVHCLLAVSKKKCWFEPDPRQCLPCLFVI
jgi:hypothetical protein